MSPLLQIRVGQLSYYGMPAGTVPSVALFAVIEDFEGAEYWGTWDSEAAFFDEFPSLAACTRFLREQMDLGPLQDLEYFFPDKYSLDRIFDSPVVSGMPPAWVVR